MSRDPRELAVSPPCEDARRGWMCASQDQSSPQESNRLTPWSWTSALQNLGKIIFCFHRLLCGVLLWQPEQTNTVNVTGPLAAEMHPPGACTLCSPRFQAPVLGLLIWTYTKARGEMLEVLHFYPQLCRCPECCLSFHFHLLEFWGVGRGRLEEKTHSE